MIVSFCFQVSGAVFFLVRMILSIESSCDESAISIFDPVKGIVVDKVYSQIKTHSDYGGIVPDLASREHLDAFVPLLNIVKKECPLRHITKIAVTTGPGLAGCLALGLALGRSLSLALGIPVCGVNHLRGHVFSPFVGLHEMAPVSFDFNFQKLLPHLGLIVSGGNTILVKITEDREVVVLGATVDDAAGEALDKGGKLLGMAYPAGPLIEEKALAGDPKRFDFPRGMVGKPDVKFSFSGLKTSLRYRLEKMNDEELERDFSDLCASYQQAVVDALVLKTKAVLKKGTFASLGLSGGVANNKTLRKSFENLASEQNRIPLFIADPKNTGDNANMIAFAAYCDPKGTVPEGENLQINPSWKLS